MLTSTTTPVDIRVRALEDISLLLTQKSNLEAVLKQFAWQQWFLNLLSTCSTIKSKSSGTLIDKVLGIFRLLHLHGKFLLLEHMVNIIVLLVVAGTCTDPRTC